MRRPRNLWRLARIWVSLAIFIWISLLFLDLHARLPVTWFFPLRYLQLVPALQLMLASGGLAMLALLLLLLSALIFGRFYCSFLCPLGALQDGLGFLRRRFSKRIRYKSEPPYHGWRYGILALFLLFLIIGAGNGMGLLDPYGHFGRIHTQIAVGPSIFLNNILSAILVSMHVYAVPPLPYPEFKLLPFSFALGILSLIILLVWQNGRTFCNTVCPVGSGLGLLSRLAPFKIYIDTGKCTLCGACSRVCKAGCIDVKSMSIDKSRCVMCFNCLSACSESGIHYGNEKVQVRPVATGRRQFVKTLGTGAVLPLMASTTTEVVEFRTTAISPPGSVSHERFHQFCIACQLCVNACPSYVLQPSLMEYGLQGIMQPLLDPETGYCNFDCIRCTEVCPTGALVAINIDEKHRLQLGKAKFLPEYCVVTLEYKNCGACSEHCPTKAVNMVRWEGHLYIPEVDPDLCVGCGACEYACPTNPLSIYVEGLKEHGIAKIPPSRKLPEEATEAVPDDFPF